MNGITCLLPGKKKRAPIALRAIGELYKALGDESQSSTMQSWENDFYLLHGALDSQRQTDTHRVVDTYDLDVQTKSDFLRLVFALETYYCIILLALGYRAVTGLCSRTCDTKSIFDGEAIRAKGIYNYSCPKHYLWVLRAEQLEDMLRQLLEEVDSVDITFYDRDLVKHLFHGIFDKKIRHSLGEIYTPDWLAELTISDSIQDDSTPETQTYLDPTCGSGTFLVQVALRFLERTNGGILTRIFGFDINPISALAAKTNILIIGSKYLDKLPNPFWIPVFQTDCLHTAFTSYGELAISTKSNIKKKLLEEGARLVGGHASLRDCFERCGSLLTSGDYDVSQVDQFLANLAPAVLSNISYVIGNPPWVNWEYLPREYKRETAYIWQYYRLFDLTGRDAAFIKEDISALITYAAADKYLASGGTLGFVIKQSLFKSSKQGAGFRQFHIAPTNTPLRVIKVEDLSAIIPFPGVATRSAVLLLRKGESTSFPVYYNEWRPRNRATFRDDEELETVLRDVQVEQNHAYPVDVNKPTSGWTSSSRQNRREISDILGTSLYRARTGLFTGGLNAAFWMHALERRGDSLLVRNLIERAKNKLPEVEVEIECALLYPFVTGAELHFWRFTYSRYILCPHTKETRIEPLPADVIKRGNPKGWNYLESFRGALEARKGFAGWEKSIHEKYFYALQRIGDYTFAPYKVAWRFISKSFLPVVITPVSDPLLGYSVPIPNEKVIFVGLDNADEAYYLCGILSSSKYRAAVESFMVQTQIGPHVLDKLSIPKFDPYNPTHVSVSKCCRTGHEDLSQVDRQKEAIDKLLED